MEKKQSKLKVSVFELVAYIISGVIGVWGLTEIVLGVVANYVSSDTAFGKACIKYQQLFGLSFLGWGLILLGIGVLVAVIVLCSYAKTSDREYEKRQRRLARLGKDESEENKVIDAEVEKE